MPRGANRNLHKNTNQHLVATRQKQLEIQRLEANKKAEAEYKKALAEWELRREKETQRIEPAIKLNELSVPQRMIPNSGSTAAAIAHLNINPASIVYPSKIETLEKKQVDIEQVITEATKKFEEGRRIGRCSRLLDPFFPIPCDANRIAGTHFIAAAGPRYGQVAEFLKMIAYHGELQIEEIISLGSRLINGPPTREYDFYDYSSGEVEECIYTATSSTDERLFDIKVQAKRISDNDILKDPELRYSNKITQSKLTLSLFEAKDMKHENPNIRQINAAIISLADDDYIDLTNSSKEIKEKLWQLFVKSLSKYTLIHCAAGLGRTGHLILTFEILKHYNELFASDDPVSISAEILKIVERIRTDRQALIWTNGQFSGAIINAAALHRFALEERYIQAGIPVYRSALPSTTTLPVNASHVDRPNTLAPVRP